MRSQILRACMNIQFCPHLKLLSTNSYSTDVKSEKNDPTSWRQPWFQRDGEWYSKFKLFASEKSGSPDMVRVLQSDISFSPDAFRKWKKQFKREAAIFDMRYIPERHEILGNDLAAAHFLVHRGAGVKFVGSPRWIRRHEDEYDLPKKYNPDYLIEAIDASNMELYFEGFQNMTKLRKLQWLSLQNCAEVDDWCLDKISGEYQTTLKYLDISNCVQITDRGIGALYRMSELRKLKVHNITSSPEFQLACLMLEDIHPLLKIEGVNYLDIENQSV